MIPANSHNSLPISFPVGTLLIAASPYVGWPILITENFASKDPLSNWNHRGVVLQRTGLTDQILFSVPFLLLNYVVAEGPSQ